VTHDLIPALPAGTDDPLVLIIICKERGRSSYACVHWDLLLPGVLRLECITAQAIGLQLAHVYLRVGRSKPFI
jgi:hypothetical protein